jgi:MoaA/NifB/PqqE/SkfB family radical SAM enzyme
LSNIKILHIEPTNACNAACPQCARETDATFNKNDLHHLTVDQLATLIDESTIKNLDKVFMCGNYGDPAAGKHTLEIFKYLRSINPTLTLGMNTNGGLRSTKWWKELATVMFQPNDYPQEYVVWSIDGLEDTNHIYRVNTNWDKIIENAQAFIQAGGRAHWEMLVFKHNDHQVEQAQQLAKDMGFKWFRAKVSRRFDTVPVSFLQVPTGWKDPIVTKGDIECAALIENSLYISATGIVYPCCWLGNTDHTIHEFSKVQQTWKTNSPNAICAATCTKYILGTSYTNQWQRAIEFK